MKKGFIVLGIVAALAAALVLFVFTSTAGMTDEADMFFDKLKQGDVAGAHSMTASAFQKATTPEQLAEFSKLLAFDKLKETSYPTHGFENDIGYLEGNITYSDDTKQPVRIEFVKEDGNWKVLHVTPKSGAGTSEVSNNSSAAPLSMEHQTAPSEDVAKALVNRSMQMLADAIIRRDFDDFYRYTSKMWQSQTTSQQLLVAFGEFIEKNIDLIHTQNVPISIKPPEVDLQNALNIDAEWETKPVRTVGNFRYVSEGGEWKLIGVAVNLKE